MSPTKSIKIKLLYRTALCGLTLTASLSGSTQAVEAPTDEHRQFEVHARGTTGEEQIQLVIDDQVVASWSLSRTLQTYQAASTLRGPVRVKYLNDEPKRDVRVDYLKIDGQLLQAEDQIINTGAFQNGKCGGGQGRTEWMRCSGYIEFQAP